VWAPDDRLIFSGTAAGPNQIHAVPADRSAPAERLLPSQRIVGDYPTSVTPDGRHVIFTRIVAGAQREIWELPLEGNATPEPLLEGEFNRGNGEVSPDGRFLMLKPVAGQGADGPLPPQVVLVQNFFEELKRLGSN
jgi:Tol biopolymer transport system component